MPRGRVIVTSSYVAADGDRRNSAYAGGRIDLRNYVRIDRRGAHCGKSGSVQDSTSTYQPAGNTCP